MKKFRLVLISILLVAVIAGGIALALPHLMAREVGIRGTITRDGKPLEWQSDPHKLIVTIVPAQRAGNFNVYPAECDTENGTFVVAKIPTGEYVVCILQLDPFPTGDLLQFAFDPAHSNLNRKVTHDGQEFLIDLPKDLPKFSRNPMPAGRPAGPVGQPKVADDDEQPEPK